MYEPIIVILACTLVYFVIGLFATYFVERRSRILRVATFFLWPIGFLLAAPYGIALMFYDIVWRGKP